MNQRRYSNTGVRYESRAKIIEKISWKLSSQSQLALAQPQNVKICLFGHLKDSRINTLVYLSST